MGINFQQPFYLLFLIPAIILLIWWLKTQKRVKGKKRYIILSLRLLLFISLIFSLARPELLFPIKGETVIFVLDKSASMKNDPKATKFIQDAVDAKEYDDRFGIISIGTDAIVEQPLTNRNNLNSLGTVVNQHGTNLTDGIRLASGMIPSNTNGRIVLVTDGLETHGDMVNEANFAKERGIVIDAYSLQQDYGDEVLISSFKVPNKLKLGEEFQGTIVIDSTTTTKGILRIYEENKLISQQSLNIEKGQNRFIFNEIATEDGFHNFRAELIADNDSIQINNKAFAYSQVDSQPKVLIIEGHNGAGDNLANALSAGNMLVNKVKSNELPNELEDYKQYSSIVLADVQATDMKDIDMRRINTAVKDMGIGLIMTGGNDSYGLGGWFKTPIEDALPVYMDLRGKENLPSLGLMLVIDKSGSMSSAPEGYDKMELAKEAAIRATEMLNENDYVGVVAFDGSPWVVVEPESAKNLDGIQEKISGIYASGGTDIYPALYEGYDQLKELDTQRKHVILLTDGQSGRNDDYEGLLNEMEEQNITVSTVAIGSDSDTNLLEDIAKMGNGRYYFSNDPSSIPKIFSKETALASRTFVVDKPHYPNRQLSTEWTALNDKLPIIDAYIATTPKQTSEVVLMSNDDDPVLSRWQYGLGRSVAWTSDIEGKWSSEWVNWENYSRYWNQVVNWTFPQIDEGNWKVETEVNDLQGQITVTIPNNNLPQMEAIIINDKLESDTIQLKPIEPNKLQGNFEANDEGTYIIQIIEKEGDKIVSSQTEGLNVSYSPEYSLLTGGEQKLEELVDISGGKIIESPDEVFSNSSSNGWERQDISRYFLTLAALLLPIDVGLRRVNISPLLLEKIKNKFRRRISVSYERESTFSSLVEKKKELKTSTNNKASFVNKETVKLKDDFVLEHKQSDNTKNNNLKEKSKENNQDTFKRLLDAKRKK